MTCLNVLVFFLNVLIFYQRKICETRSSCNLVLSQNFKTQLVSSPLEEQINAHTFHKSSNTVHAYCWTPPCGKILYNCKRPWPARQTATHRNARGLTELELNKIRASNDIKRCSHFPLSLSLHCAIVVYPLLAWAYFEDCGSPNSVADQNQVGRPPCAFHLCRM